MNEREILESTYFDVVDVYRPSVNNGEWNPNPSGKTLIYNDVKCALSQTQSRVGNTTQGTPINQIVHRLQLFYPPDIIIKAGDELHVTSQGETYILDAGKPFKYVSHNVVICTQEDEA